VITKSTLLILGAGASKPYGMPLGAELRDDVLHAYNNFAYRQVLSKLRASDSDFEDFAKDLATSGFSSVDAFLEERSKWTTIGKAAMAFCLLISEYKTRHKLFPPQQPKDHWYQTLWSHMRTPTWSALKKQSLCIVTFNYDRSLEHYLTQVISNHYAIKSATAVASLPIITCARFARAVQRCNVRESDYRCDAR
jgi:hypothetical protein